MLMCVHIVVETHDRAILQQCRAILQYRVLHKHILQ